MCVIIQLQSENVMISLENDNFDEISDERGKMIWRCSCLPNDRSKTYWNALWVRLKAYFVNQTGSSYIPNKEEIWYFFVYYGGTTNNDNTSKLSMIEINHFNHFWQWFVGACLIVKDLKILWDRQYLALFASRERAAEMLQVIIFCSYYIIICCFFLNFFFFFSFFFGILDFADGTDLICTCKMCKVIFFCVWFV